MLNLREKFVLTYIVQHCNDIIHDVENLTKEEFKNNGTIQRSVCLSIFQIGELSKTFSKDFLKEYTGVPWGKIKGIRDIIGHAYGTIMFDDIWDSATIDVPALKKYCESIINEN